ncbi:phospholipase [Kitasatospora camelliae]|uniref:Phospholipase n=1 Tax=Kitasatospora camelliae TaxID=3156397 RepID=A0AAU8K3R0_9ACTN
MLRRRLRRPLLALAAVLGTLPLTALAATPAAAEPAPPTPYLDPIEKTLKEVSPGLQGQVWERTAGNRLDADGGWLLQTPGCWGDSACRERPGTARLLDRMTGDIAKATRTVDISTLAPLPEGAFQDAIVAGLKASVAAGNHPTVRILVGAAPLYHLNVVPSSYRDELNRKLGPAAGGVTLHVASMTTSRTAFSWNHSKILVVDGRTAVVGGINDWKNDYLDTTHPVTDVDLALTGPAAGSAGRYLDQLWSWTCSNAWNPVSVWLSSTKGASCPTGLYPPSGTPDASGASGENAPGTVPVIAVGGLGAGIRDADRTSAYRPALPDASQARCGVGLHDNTNADRDYETVNPEENALRALVAGARSHVEISQQDLNATCPPLARYDIRLYDLLAKKLTDGVKLRIVVSDPANRGAVGSGGYSQIKSLNEVSDLLRDKLTALTGDRAKATAAMCSGLQLATYRAAATPTWADGHPYALHHKLVSVDGSAFYIGSKNLYPAWLQDFGYIVESPEAAARLDRDLLTPQWTYSSATATYDWAAGRCG